MAALSIVPRDIAIFEAIYSCRVLTSTQIAARFYPRMNGEPRNDVWNSKEANPKCRQRLRRMMQKGYLERSYLPATPKEGRKPYLYFLAQKGVAELAKETELSRRDINWRPRNNQLSEFHTLPHLIAMNDVRISIEVDADQRGVEILTWEPEGELKARPIKASVDGEQVTFFPDAYFSLFDRDENSKEDEGYYYAYFLEVDRGTEPAPTDSSKSYSNYFTTKVTNYLRYLASGASYREFGFELIRVLTVTTDWQRLEKLVAATESRGGGKQFWFTTFNDIVPIKSALKKPIWLEAGSRERRTLIW